MRTSRRTLSVGAAVAVAVGLLCAVPAQAGVTYDAGTGFVPGPAPQSPTAVWQYFQTNRGPMIEAHMASYQLLTVFNPAWGGKPNLEGWCFQDSPYYPVIAKNAGALPIDVSGDMEDDVPPGGLFVHPYGQPLVLEAAAIGWLSPVTGLVDISLTVTDADSAVNNPNSDGVSWYLDHRAGATAVPLASGVVDADGPPYDPSGEDKTDTALLPGVAVSAGDFILLTIHSIGTGGTDPMSTYYYDATLLSFTITEQGGGPPALIPEPAGIGLLGLALLQVRRSRR